MTSKETEKKDDLTITPFVIGTVIVLIIVSLGGILLYGVFGKWEEAGVFGDSFGVVNALFSGLAFAGIIYTILLQRKELVLQRRDLELTRDELKGQKAEFKKQNETLTHQQFEDTFFSLLSMITDVRSNILKVETKDGKDKGYEGFDFFMRMKDNLNDNYDVLCEYSNKISKNSKLESWQERKLKGYGLSNFEDCFLPENISRIAYIQLYENNHLQLDHYFKSLYQVLKYLLSKEKHELGEAYIDSGLKINTNYKLKEERIKFKYLTYAGYIQAQMSSAELLLLFYDALFFPKMKRLVYHYKILDNLNKENLLIPQSDVTFYDGDTFYLEGLNNEKHLIPYKKLEFKSRKDILTLKDNNTHLQLP